MQTEPKNRKDFLSVDELTAISSYGDVFNIGDLVKHDGAGDEVAKIFSFFLDVETFDVKAQTEKGFARISFLRHK